MSGEANLAAWALTVVHQYDNYCSDVVIAQRQDWDSPIMATALEANLHPKFHLSGRSQREHA
jgi:hypothetical protein